jgi:hypothetical protein
MSEGDGEVYVPTETDADPEASESMTMGKEGQEGLRDPWFDQPVSQTERGGDGVQE